MDFPREVWAKSEDTLSSFPPPKSGYDYVGWCRDKAVVGREAVSLVRISVLEVHTIRYAAKSWLSSCCFYDETWHARSLTEGSAALFVLRWGEDSAREHQSFTRLD